VVHRAWAEFFPISQKNNSVFTHIDNIEEATDKNRSFNHYLFSVIHQSFIQCLSSHDERE
jgi:hypothetical protein